MVDKIKQLLFGNQLGMMLIIVVSVLLSFNIFQIIQRNLALQEQIETLSQEIAIIRLENQQIEYELNYIQTDSYVESAAKKEFNTVKPGEKVVILPKRPVIDSQAITDFGTSQPTSGIGKMRNNLNAWYLFLLGKEV